MPATTAMNPAKIAEFKTVYSSTSEIRRPLNLLVEIFRGFYDGRELAWRIFVRNLNGLYRQTLLGLFWAFLPPLANTAIWIFLRSQNVFEIGETNVDSTVYILTGMILWQAFIDAFQAPMDVMNKNKNMIAKLNFPRESLMLVGFGEVLFNLGIRVLLLIPAFIYYQVPFNWGSLFAPIAILSMILWAISLGLLLMPLASLYKDVGRFLALFMPFWMIITPIIYVAPTTYPGTLLTWLNPASPLLLLSRDFILFGDSPHLPIGLIFAAASFPLALAGMMLYRISLPILIERLPA
ncbi:MAG: ABC transporter permease [Planctomycetota bacterium]